MGVVDLDDAGAPDFLESRRVVLLAFLDPADPASRRLRASLEVFAARRAGELAVGAIDVSRHRLVAQGLDVRGVPSALLFVDGELRDRVVGAPPESVLEEMARLGAR